MSNTVFSKLLQYLLLDDIDSLLINDNTDSLTNFIKNCNTSSYLTSPIIGNCIITDGNVYTTLKIINDLVLMQGEYKLLINNENNHEINTYLIKRANEIYQNLGINVSIIIDDITEYSKYTNSYVTLIGSEDFIMKTKKLLPCCNYIIV